MYPSIVKATESNKDCLMGCKEYISSMHFWLEQDIVEKRKIQCTGKSFNFNKTFRCSNSRGSWQQVLYSHSYFYYSNLIKPGLLDIRMEFKLHAV